MNKVCAVIVSVAFADLYPVDEECDPESCRVPKALGMPLKCSYEKGTLNCSDISEARGDAMKIYC